MNTRTAKYLTPRLLGDAASTQTHTYTETQADTAPFESSPNHFAADFSVRSVLSLLLNEII